MRVKTLIVELGGNKPVAERCRVSSAAVSNWIAANAVPAEHHITLWDMALAAGVAWEPPRADDIRKRLGAPPVPAPTA